MGGAVISFMSLITGLNKGKNNFEKVHRIEGKTLVLHFTGLVTGQNRRNINFENLYI